VDGIPAQIADWSGWTFGFLVCLLVILAFLRGMIVSKSVLDMQSEATKRAQEANAENSIALRELREMGNTTIQLVKALKSSEKEKR